LHNDPVSTSRDRRTRHRCHHVPQSRAMAWIRDDRKVRQLVHQRNGSEVEHVTHSRIEGANSALAQNHLAVALREDVLGAEQEIRYRRGHSALQQHGPAEFPDSLEQRIILHVAGTDLNAVGVLSNQSCSFIVHRFGHDWKPGFFARPNKQFQAFHAESLKRIWRAAWLERTAAKRRCAGIAHQLGSANDLGFRFNRAWSRYHGYILAA